MTSKEKSPAKSLKPSQKLATKAQKLHAERLKLEAKAEQIRRRIGELDGEISGILRDVVAAI